MTQARPWLRALAWLALLGPFFFLSYGWANALAAAQTGVPSVVFAWERHVPFWAWTIVPYWSIDAFYVASLFVCRDRQELDRHALRLLTAQLIAVACFALWPLRFSFVRPEADGVFGAMFDVLMGFDKPFNQAPSLHIVLLVILWVRFAAHLQGAWRVLLHGWFALIGLSVLTTYQHHFLDIPTGLLLGWLCCWLWPMRDTPTPWREAKWASQAQRWKLAAAYFSGALMLSALAVSIGGVALWLWWPTVSLALVALCHAWLGPVGLQKRANGRLSLASRWLFAPYLLAAWINSRWWTRRAPMPVQVRDDVWLGRVPTPAERDGFDAVVDLSAELPLRQARVGDIVLPQLDLVPMSAGALREAAAAIEAAHTHGRVLVCCALGYSRSAASVAAWLVLTGRAVDVAAAVERVRTARPAVVLRAAHLQALHALHIEAAVRSPSRGVTPVAA